MKNTLYILCFFFSLKLAAQDSQLFEHTWNLHEILIEDILITPPSPQFSSELNFINNSLEVVHQSCEEGYFSDLTYTNTISFNLIAESIIGLPGVCGDPVLNEFILNHYGFYGLDNGMPLNTFNYEITTDNGIITLTITNANSDTAIYRNIPLSVEENTLTSLKLFYNKNEESLLFTGALTEQGLKTVIYTVTGQKQQESTRTNNVPMDLSKLSNGIYFITLQTETNQKITRKFIKY